jgi:hypothetical protein
MNCATTLLHVNVRTPVSIQITVYSTVFCVKGSAGHAPLAGYRRVTAADARDAVLWLSWGELQGQRMVSAVGEHHGRQGRALVCDD